MPVLSVSSHGNILLLRGVTGWSSLSGWKRQLIPPGRGDGLRRDLAPGASDAVAC